MNQTRLDHLAEMILGYLRDKINHVIPVVELLSKLNCNIDTMKKGVSVLEEWGYDITLTPTEICLTRVPDILSDIEIKKNLNTKFIGNNIVCYGSVKSTNDIAKEKAESNAPNGTIIIADQQTKGRGRLGRSWHSPPGCGASISVILKPEFLPEKAPGVSLIVALALTETIDEYCPGCVRIKWPNDIILSGKKTAGILTELSADKNNINYLIVGIGININQSVKDFDDEIKDIATSVRIINGNKINRSELVGKFLNRLENEYLEYSENLLTNSLDRLRKYSSLIGEAVSLLSGKKIISGKAVDIDSSGALIVDQNGELIKLTCGEVTVIKK